MDNWEYEACDYICSDADGTHWTDWEPCTKEYAETMKNSQYTIIRSIYNGYKDD